MSRILMTVLLCGLSFSFAFAKTLSKVETYRLYLSKLDKNDPASIGKSVEEYHRIYAAKDDTKSQDASEDDWWKFANKVFDRLGDSKEVDKVSGLFDGTVKNEAIDKALDSGHIKDGDKEFEKTFGRKTTDFIEKLYENGMELYSSEGMPYVDFDPDYVDRAFSTYLSPPEREFLKIRMEEFKAGFSEDAGLMVPWDEVRKRIVAWDGYLKKFPYSADKEEVEGEMQEYLQVYLSGMANSDTCENSKEPGTLNPELRKSYETFLAQDKACKYYGVVRDYYRALQVNGFKCEKVNAGDYLAKVGLKSMEDTQPMLR